MTEVKNAKCVKYLVYNFALYELPPFPVTASTLGELEFSQVYTPWPDLPNFVHKS